MKKYVLAYLVSTWIWSLATAGSAWAEKLDLATHNSLIQKLESVSHLETKDSMIQQTSLAHRLADLYAERARLLSMDQEGQGEKIHLLKIQSDRRKAIDILQNIVDSLPESEQGTVLLQMAHLHELLHEPQESLRICKGIESHSKRYDARTRALVQIQLGDVAFQQGSLEEAEDHFQRALQIRENPRLAYTDLRLSWVHFNQGQTQRAERELIQLLETPQLFQSPSGVLETSFQEDVSRDLATFMAKNDLREGSIETLSRLSPEKARQKNLRYLAEELDRTAKKRSALKVWAVVGAQGLSFEEQVARQVQVARIEYDLGNRDQLLIEMDKSLALLQDSRCSKNPECGLATQNLRHILTDWGKAEERKPSKELILGYQKYTQSYDDFEMNHWAAQAATKRRQYAEAFVFYTRAATLLKSQNLKTENLKRLFEGSLLGAIEVAELARSSELRLKAYQQYLQFNPSGTKVSEVRYQIAHWFYEKKDFQKAAEEFGKLALSESMPAAPREKSGDLCLDSLVLLKNEAVLESTSFQLAHSLKSKTQEYLGIYRKAVLNQSARVLNAPQGESNRDAEEKEWRKLQALPIADWPREQRKQVIQNRMILSYRLRALDSLAQNSRQLLTVPGLSAEERSLALQHLAWIAEVRMNFEEALAWMAKMSPQVRRQADSHMKRALLLELAQRNPTAEYVQFIELSKDRQKRQYAAHQIVIHSRRPQIAFQKYESLLSGHTGLYRSAGIFAFEKSHDIAFAKRLLKKSVFRNSPEGLLVSHQFAFKDLWEQKQKISRMQLRSGPDGRLQRDLKQRMQALKQMESWANESIRQKDSTLQLLQLAQLAEENARLARDILALPLPRGLKAQEREKYGQQLQASIQPYQIQSQNIQKKILDIWRQAMAQNSFQNLYSWSRQAEKPGCQFAALEIRVLRASARQSGLAEDPFGNLTEERQKVASEVQALQMKLQKNPFNSDDLEKMKSLQLSLGRGPMVAYLDQRLSELRRQKERN